MLSTVIPVCNFCSVPRFRLTRFSKIMTGSIVAGWSMLSYTLGRWSSLGYMKGIVAGTLIRT